MDDLELSKLCREGDRRAQKALYERYSNRLYAICIRYSGCRDTAQDLLHDGFIKIFSSFDKFTWRGEGSLSAWMDRVIVNTALQYLRDRKRKAAEVEVEEIPEVEDVEDEDINRIPLQVLFNMIEELPDGYRTVFNLFVLEKKSHREIGEILNINERSSSSQLLRAKRVLADKVRDWLEENDI